MSGVAPDPLDRIQERGQRSLERGAIEVTFPTRDVLALVDVARAARNMRDSAQLVLAGCDEAHLYLTLGPLGRMPWRRWMRPGDPSSRVRRPRHSHATRIHGIRDPPMVGSGRDLRVVADPVEPSQQRGKTSERGNPSGKQPS